MMLLLDTHAFLWFCQDDRSLTARAKALIEDPSHRKHVSVASCWEIAINAGLAKLKLGEPSKTYISGALARTGFEVLPISVEHATDIEGLPLHHRDPFDRMLIAQALAEKASVISADPAFDLYGVSRLW